MVQLIGFLGHISSPDLTRVQAIFDAGLTESFRLNTRMKSGLFV
jgi:hypothetical protein